MARTLQRTRGHSASVRFIVGGLVTLLVGTAGAVGALPVEANGALPRVPYVKSQTPLTDTALGLNTQVDVTDMVSSRLGYPIASPASSPPGWYYLVRTTDVGRSWVVRGTMPFAPFEGPYGANQPISLQFVNPAVGYASLQGGPLYVTNDAGRSWSKVAAPGSRPSFRISGDTVFVVSDVCATAPSSSEPLRCPSHLSSFRVGSTTALRTVIIPALGPARPWRSAVELAATSSSSVVVAEGTAQVGNATSLLATSDGGDHWRLLPNPCRGLIVEQLLATAAGRSLLYCYGAGGMNQGTSELWSSSDGLTTWQLVDRADEGHSARDSIGDVSNTLSFSNNHALLYGALGGAAGGLEVSRDDGRRWSTIALPLAWYGGASEYFSPVGATGGILSVAGGPQFVTTDGTTWTELPRLPAGTFHGLSICTSAHGTSVHRAPTMTGIPASTFDYPIVFTNTSAVDCYLNGVPTTQPVSGPTRAPIGTTSYPMSIGGRGDFVVLRAHGGVASIVVASDAVSDYPSRYCAAQTMTGLSITFASPATFYVAIPPRAICLGAPTIRNGGVSRGVVTWL